MSNNSNFDVKEITGNEWYYSEVVKEHFFNPKNFVIDEPKKGEYDAYGEVGSSICGDVMRVWIKVDSKSKRIKKIGWKTFGCASAIAATSIMSVMVTENGGMKLEEAEKITPRQITERLSGLPMRKVHCSVLGDQALRSAIKNYMDSNKSSSRT